MNRVIISGNLGADAEIREVGSTDVTTFSVGVSERWKDKNGDKQERTDWFNCEKWGAGEVFTSFLKKGTKVLVEGKMRCEQYDKDGQNRTSWKLRAQSIEFLTPKQDKSKSEQEYESKYSDLPF